MPDHPPTARVHVEVSRGGYVKRELTADGHYHLDYVSPLPSPFNYGCLPDTLGPDGDPLDAVLLGAATPVGTVVEARVWGVVRFLDAGVIDDKLVCGAAPPTRADHRRLIRFFKAYAWLRGGLNRLRGRPGPTRFLGLALDPPITPPARSR